MLTPLAIVISTAAIFPKLLFFKEKVVKQNLLLLYFVLMLNMAKCLTEMSDLIILKQASYFKDGAEQGKKHCEGSVLVQIFVFDLANCFTVS